MLPPCHPTRPHSELPQWQGLSPSLVRQWPLDALSSASDRFLTRFAWRAALTQISAIEGVENVLPQRDPFLLVANHSSRREAIFLPALLVMARGGHVVRFLADWNFRLIPGMGYLYRRSGTITLTRKAARPRILNVLKPLFEPRTPPLEEARRHLLSGGSIAIFPEGTVNRDPDRLLRGRRAAARLSLEAQVPVVPVGIRFAKRQPSTGLIDSWSPMSIHIGAAMIPACDEPSPPSPQAVTAWNRRLMAEIGRLSGKGCHGAEPRNPLPGHAT